LAQTPGLRDQKYNLLYKNEIVRLCQININNVEIVNSNLILLYEYNLNVILTNDRKSDFLQSY
jgi:hypothetical protein